MSNFVFYDIESLNNLFSVCMYDNTKNILYMFYLTDVDISYQNYQPVINMIYQKNHNLYQLKPEIRFYDLHDINANEILKSLLGTADVYPITPDYQDWDGEKFPYICGYNSHNYDLTMLALYLENTMDSTNKFTPVQPSTIRFYNNCLFDPLIKANMPEFLRRAAYGSTNPGMDASDCINGVYYTKPVSRTACAYKGYKFYEYWINSGKHIDVARLNEKQSRVALKRLLGMLGYQILEAETDLANASTNLSYQEILSTLAYNVSDVINLKNLSEHEVYTSAFELKRQMLMDDPKLIYKRANIVEEVIGPTGIKMLKARELYEADMKTVKSYRMTINSSSAQLAGQSLCPYESLSDDIGVSFMYPSEEKAKEKGVTRRNILEETNQFIDNTLVPIATPDEGMEIIKSLKLMIRMYQAIENNNFDYNASDDALNLTNVIKQVAPDGKISLPYMGPDGNATDCYITFSVGGIHGAQYNKELYDEDCRAYEHMKKTFEKVKSVYGNALNLVIDTSSGKPKKRKTFVLDNITYQVSDFVRSGSTMKSADWKAKFDNSQKPELFEKGSLKKKYTITSYGKCNHEDFVSYYPNLLINMQAFKNENLIDETTGAVKDHYEEIFGLKQAYKKLIKDPLTTKEDAKVYKIKQKGVKLILNSASGAADSDYNTPIRMNNRIIAMRIIGQLFAWRIGQEQALAGAEVISTNTDGLYTIFDEQKNDAVLDRVSKTIGIEIEPERLYIVSKDANNRIEMDYVTNVPPEYQNNVLAYYVPTNLSGGTLACANGPNPEKSLAHPAIIDWGLSEYLKFAMHTNTMSDYNPDITDYLFDTYAKQIFPDKKKYLQMFQNIISSSTTTICMNFGTTMPLDQIPDTDLNTVPLIGLQHYNRIFVVDKDKVEKAGFKNSIIYISAAYIRPNETPTATKHHSPISSRVLSDIYKLDSSRLSHGLLAVKKLNGIELSTPCMIINEALDETQFDPDWLDLEYYKNLTKDTYTKNWKNDNGGEE